MARLVWIDTELMTHENEAIRRDIYRSINMTCGWKEGLLLAQIPSWKEIRRIISEKTAGERSIFAQGLVIEQIIKNKKSMPIFGTWNNNYEDEAKKIPFIDFLISEKGRSSAECLKYRNAEQFFMDLPSFKARYSWIDQELLAMLDLIVLGSNRIDVVDQFFPFSGPVPMFEHLIRRFGDGGDYRTYLSGPRELWIHLSERPNDHVPATLKVGETVRSFLTRINASRLTEAFNISIAVWRQKVEHDRQVIGDIGGLHLGEGLGSRRAFLVSPIERPMDERRRLDEQRKARKVLVKVIS